MNTLFLLFAMTFIVYVDLRILTAVLPSIAVSLGASAGGVGFATTAYSLSYSLVQLVYGPLSDRLSRIAVVRLAGIGFCLCTILSSLAATMGQFLILRLLTGVFAGAVIPLTILYIADTIEYGRRQVVLGRVSAISSVAMAFSASIGGTVAHFVSWRLMLLGYGLLAAVPVGLMWRGRADRPAVSPAPSESYRRFLANPYALFIYGAVLAESLFLWGSLTYFAPFAMRGCGLDQFEVGLLIALFGVGTMAGGLLMGPIRRFLSEKGLAALGGTLLGLSCLAVIPVWSVWGFALAMLAMGLGYVLLHTTLQLRGTEISSASRGKAFALFPVSNFLGIAAGSAIFGEMADAGSYEAMFLAAGLGLLLVGLATAAAPGSARSPGKKGDV